MQATPVGRAPGRHAGAADPVAEAATLRRATPEDVPTLRGVLARAFDQDPLMNCLVRQDERRALRMERMFEVMLRQLSSSLSDTYTTRDRAGAAVWKREMKMPIRDLAFIPETRSLPGDTWAMGRQRSRESNPAR